MTDLVTETTMRVMLSDAGMPMPSRVQWEIRRYHTPLGPMFRKRDVELAVVAWLARQVEHALENRFTAAAEELEDLKKRAEMEGPVWVAAQRCRGPPGERELAQEGTGLSKAFDSA